MLDILSSTLECYRVSVWFYPEEDIHLDAWIGAVFRNRFLYFADSICDEEGISLRSHLDKLSLSPDHVYYKQMKGGFPKGLLFDFRDIPGRRKDILYRNTIYSFDIVLIGKAVCHFPMVVQALSAMCADGIGHPLVPLHLIDVLEQNGEEQIHLLYSENGMFLNMPEYAVCISDFLTDTTDMVSLRLTFHTPLSLYQVKNKVEPELSYQHKMNGFPSFYQFVRSVAYRWSVLAMLYGEEMLIEDKKEFEEQLDQWIEASSLAVLQEASLRYRKIHSSPKKSENHVYVMGGYEGHIVFQNVPKKYLPLLVWGMHIAVGDNVQYGMGSYSVEVLSR